jgi:hypothetical protein
VLKAGKISREEEVTNDEEWDLITPGKFVYIDSGNRGKVVVLKDVGCPFYRTGVRNSNPKGSAWLDITNNNNGG